MSFVDLVRNFQTILDEQERRQAFSGAVMLRGWEREDGREPAHFEAAYGFANRTWEIANKTITRFRIASISKIFTAVAVLQLVEAGKLRLDKPIVPLLELQDTQIPAQVTLRHLLTMTSGIADWFDESSDWEANWEALRRAHPLYLLRSNADYLPLFVHQKPLAAPGERYAYNGGGYILLGLAIEKASGLPYERYIQQHIFTPTGMARSGFFAIDDVKPKTAEGYIALDGEDGLPSGWKKNYYAVTPSAAADGGATSTLDDLARFVNALRGGRVLGPQMTEIALTPQVQQRPDLVRDLSWWYGFGLIFNQDSRGKLVRWGHTGEEDGISCRLYCYPQQKLDLIILGNQSWCAGQLGWLLHDQIMQAEIGDS